MRAAWDASPSMLGAVVTKEGRDYHLKECEKIVSAALLAALDPEDEALVRAIVKRLILSDFPTDDRLAGIALNTRYEKYAVHARAAVAALRMLATAQGAQ